MASLGCALTWPSSPARRGCWAASCSRRGVPRRGPPLSTRQPASESSQSHCMRASVAIPPCRRLVSQSAKVAVFELADERLRANRSATLLLVRGLRVGGRWGLPRSRTLRQADDATGSQPVQTRGSVADKVFTGDEEWSNFAEPCTALLPISTPCAKVIWSSTDSAGHSPEPLLRRAPQITAQVDTEHICDAVHSSRRLDACRAAGMPL